MFKKIVNKFRRGAVEVVEPTPTYTVHFYSCYPNQDTTSYHGLHMGWVERFGTIPRIGETVNHICCPEKDFIDLYEQSLIGGKVFDVVHQGTTISVMVNAGHYARNSNRLWEVV